MQVKPSGQIKPCCRFDIHHASYKDKKITDHNVNKTSLSAAHNSAFWNQLRTDMVEGKKIAGCWKCDRDDEAGTFSLRYNTNHSWGANSQVVTASDGVDLKYLELTTGRLCNLKCRTCSSDLSTTWEEDDQVLASVYKDRKNYGYRPPSLSIKLDENSVQKLTMIKLTGGEPMMAPEFIPFLDRIIATTRASQISIEIYSNASWIPKETILSRLNQFKRVSIFLSIDGLGQVNDYIRFPSHWATIEAATHRWVQHSLKHEQFSIVFSPTINLYNVLQLEDMFKWWNDIQFQYFGEKYIFSLAESESKAIRDGSYIHSVGRVSPTLLQTPSYLSACLLPDKTKFKEGIFRIKQELVEWLKLSSINKTDSEMAVKQSYYRRYLFMIDHIQSHILPAPKILEQDPALLQTFLSFTADLDKLRGQSFQDSLPELWMQVQYLADYRTRINEVSI